MKASWHVLKCHIYRSFEYLQEWNTTSMTSLGSLFQCLKMFSVKESFLIFNLNLLWHSSCPTACYLGEAFNTVVESDKVYPEPPFLQSAVPSTSPKTCSLDHSPASLSFFGHVKNMALSKRAKSLHPSSIYFCFTDSMSLFLYIIFRVVLHSFKSSFWRERDLEQKNGWVKITDVKVRCPFQISWWKYDSLVWVQYPYYDYHKTENLDKTSATFPMCFSLYFLKTFNTRGKKWQESIQIQTSNL